MDVIYLPGGCPLRVYPLVGCMVNLSIIILKKKTEGIAKIHLNLVFNLPSGKLT